MNVPAYEYLSLGPSSLTSTVHPRGKKYESRETIIERSRMNLPAKLVLP